MTPSAGASLALQPAHGVVDAGVEPELGERAGVDEQGDPLARGQLAGGVLALDPLLRRRRAAPRARRSRRSSASGRRIGLANASVLDMSSRCGPWTDQAHAGRACEIVSHLATDAQCWQERDPVVASWRRSSAAAC